ncbi:MAG: enoyl-CoA hydratase-related protein [Myxococcota bacterium]
MTETVETVRHGAVFQILLNRPERINALGPELVAGLVAALEQAQNPEIRAVALRGKGPGFCAGGDIKEFGAALDHDGLDASMLEGLHRCVETIQALPKPVVALVHGPCAGAGVSLMLACDLAIASMEATFNLAYLGIGLSPDGGSTYFVPRHVGRKKAFELFASARTFGVHEALDLGLINRFVPTGELPKAGRDLLMGLAAGPTAALGRLKHLLHQSFDHDLRGQLGAEAQQVEASAKTRDFAEGVAAFIEKRKPIFEGS